MTLRDQKDPRAYFRSSNAETMILHSETSEARLTFYTSNIPAGTSNNLAFSACNDSFTIIKNDQTTLAQWSADGIFRLPNTVSEANQFRIAPDAPSQKAFVVRDYNPASDHSFVGIGFSNDSLSFQTAATSNTFAFVSGTKELAQLRASPTTGHGQLGINIPHGASLSNTTALDVRGNAAISGDVSVAGTLTFNAAAANIATLDPATSRIPLPQLPTGLVFTDSNTNKLDPSLFPTVPASPLIRATRNVGIGTRTAYERLHVQGSALVTDRLGIGIGTQSPAARLHIAESNATIPILHLEALGGGPILSSAPLHLGSFDNGRRPFVGVGTTVPLAPISYSPPPQIIPMMSVAGDITISGSITGTTTQSAIRAPSIILTDPTLPQSPSPVPILYPEILNNGSNTMRAFLPFEFNRPIYANDIRAHGATSAVRFRNSSVHVDGDLYIQGQTYNLSDIAVKTNIIPLTDPLHKLANIRGYAYQKQGASGAEWTAGLLAHEVAAQMPEATRPFPTDPTKMSVNYEAIIPVLVEAIHALQARIHTLESNTKFH